MFLLKKTCLKNAPIGVIPVDAIYTPIKKSLTRYKYTCGTTYRLRKAEHLKLTALFILKKPLKASRIMIPPDADHR
jgi:hypothetical protein